MANKININFEYFDIKENKEKKITIAAEEGEDLLHLAQDNNLPLEGACGGSLACATCHVYIKPTDLNNKKDVSAQDSISDDEDAMLDTAYSREENSRLGCQFHITPEDSITVEIPKYNRNSH